MLIDRLVSSCHVCSHGSAAEGHRCYLAMQMWRRTTTGIHTDWRPCCCIKTFPFAPFRGLQLLGVIGGPRGGARSRTSTDIHEHDVTHGP